MCIRDRVCGGDTVFERNLNFQDIPNKLGQCPCSPTNFGGLGEPDGNYCLDDSAQVYIKVYVQPGFTGSLQCSDYTVRVSNGMP